MRDFALLIFIMVMLFFTLKKPFIGILMWCWVSYMVPQKLSWGFMVNFPVAALIAVTFFVSFLFTKEKRTNTMREPIAWLVLFDVWLIITFLVNPMTDSALLLFKMAMKVQLFALFSYIFITSKERLHQILMVIAFSIIFYGVKGGIATVTSGGSTRIWGPPGGFFEGNNELGLTLLVAMPIIYYFSTIAKHKWMKYCLYGFVLLSAGSVLGTQSRGALVAIVCCGFFFWLKSNHKVITLAALLVITPISYNFMPPAWQARMATIVESNEGDYDGSVQGRFNAWRMSINIASVRPMGGGFDTFNNTNFYLYAPNPRDVHDAHSIYFKVLGQHGYPGLFIFLMLWFSAWRMASKVIRLCKDDQQMQWACTMARMLQISLIAYGSGGAFLGLTYFDLPYHILVCIVALYNVVLQEREKNSNAKQVNVEENVSEPVLALGQRAPQVKRV